jgi:hypothetical protein
MIEFKYQQIFSGNQDILSGSIRYQNLRFSKIHLLESTIYKANSNPLNYIYYY